jgi:hypothetical protein
MTDTSSCSASLPLPRLCQGVWHFPVHHVRGGTSTGLVIAADVAPRDQALREELLRHLMGVPLDGEAPGNRQITGLGRGVATSNKVFFAAMETAQDGTPRLVSTLAQLAADHGRIDWSVNCGNMSAALQLWAFDCGLLSAAAGVRHIDIRNTNTGVISTSRMTIGADGRFATARIPGVDGAFPAVDLFLHAPAGAKTGALLPTGRPLDRIGGVRASCVDVAVPMVILDAAEFGKSGHESLDALNADDEFRARLRAIWIEAGLMMGLTGKDGAPMSREEIARSETIPKVCIVGAPRHGGDLAVRYFTPQTLHGSMAVSGGSCLAAAALIPGTIAYAIAGKHAAAGESELQVAIEHPAGMLDTTVRVRMNGPLPDILSSAYRRSAQVLLSGYAPLYRASPALWQALAAIAAAQPVAMHVDL